MPYFYSFKIGQDTGKNPFGERSHSINGIVEYYKEYLFLNNIDSIFDLLKNIYYKQSLNGYCRCPCGSGKNINQCYDSYEKLFSIIEKLPHTQEDLENIRNSLDSYIDRINTIGTPYVLERLTKKITEFIKKYKLEYMTIYGFRHSLWCAWRDSNPRSASS